MLLNEIFTQQMPWKVREHRPDYFDVKFKIGNIDYIFRASSFIDDETGEMDPASVWDIEFYPDLDIPREQKFGILQSGNSFQVFNTVVDIMREFIKEYKPKELQFSAAEPSRMKLYKRMVNTLLPNWSAMFGVKQIIVSNN